jgi:diguanylate cyclase (GGDEF)-like protein/PAS domain S-box-containing protein
MCTAEGKGQHYSVDKAGVWVECVYTRKPVIHNDYAGLPDSRRKGLPPGHAPVIRELVVPIMRGDLIVAIFGVGNKPTDYTSEDVDIVLELANLSWDIIQRKRSEEALKDSERKYRMLHESMMDGFVRVAMDGRIVEHNHVYAEMLGYSEAELAALTYNDITPEKWHEAEDRIVQSQILKRGYSEIYEKEYRRKDGSIFPVELRAVLLRNEHWEPGGIWAIVRDITQRKQAEEALRESEARFRTALQDVQTIAVQGYAPDGRIQYWNKASESLYGYSAQEAIGQDLVQLIVPPEMRDDVRQAIQQMAESGQPRQMEELSLMRKDGSRVPVYSSHVVVQRPGRATELFCLDVDLTERKRAEAALKESEWRNRIVSELTTDYIFVVDVERSGAIKLKWASDNMARITGRMVEDAATSDRWAEIIHPGDRERFFAFLNHIISTAESGELECRTFYKSGEERWVHIFASTQAGGEDTIMTIVGAIDDITMRKRAEKALEATNAELTAALEREKKLARTDMLTGVNNRRNLYELIACEFEISARYHQPLSLMMFDLDHFKKVNDTFGHIVGDQILARVTKAACAELRSADSIGRYGGEEFIILLPMTTAQQAYSLAERIRENAAKIRVSTPIGEASVTISIGIVEMKHGIGPDKSVDDLIRRADQAMYAAKQSGRNCVVISQ